MLKQLLQFINEILRSADRQQRDAIPPKGREHDRSQQNEPSPPISVTVRSELQIPEAVIEAYRSEQKGANTRDKWRLGVEATAATLLIGSIFLGWRQIRLTQDQIVLVQRQLEASDRPWIKVQTQIAAPFKPTADAVQLNLTVGMTNIGNSVATNVEIHGELFPASGEEGIDPPLFVEPVQRQQKLCAVAREGGRTDRERRFRNESSIAVFPKETVSQSIGLVMDNATMKARAATFRPGGQSMPYPPLLPILVGCVDYRFANSSRHHQTGFVYQIERINDPAKPDALMLLDLNNISVPAPLLRLQLWVFGGQYAD